MTPFGPGFGDILLQATRGGRLATNAIVALAILPTVMIIALNPPDPAYDGSDLRLGLEAFNRLVAGEAMYGWDMAAEGDQPLFFHYPPSAALIFGLFSAVDPQVAAALWRLGSVLALIVSLGWRAGLLAACSWPLYIDLYVCNGTAFSVAAMVAVLRSPSAMSFGLLGTVFALAPRSPLVPLVAVIAITYRRSAWPMALGIGIVIASSLAVGQVADFIAAALGSTSEMSAPANLGPSSLIGIAWLAVAVPLAVALAGVATRWRDRTTLGVSMLMAAPYWLPTTFIYGFIGFFVAMAERFRHGPEQPRHPRSRGQYSAEVERGE